MYRVSFLCIFFLHIFFGTSAPAGACRALFCKQRVFQGSLQITFWQRNRNLRKISFRSALIARLEVLSASSYGQSKVKIEFWSQCKVLLLLSVCIVYLSYAFSSAPQRPQGPVGRFSFCCENNDFKDRSKSRFDSGIVIYAKFHSDPHR